MANTPWCKQLQVWQYVPLPRPNPSYVYMVLVVYNQCKHCYHGVSINCGSLTLVVPLIVMHFSRFLFCSFFSVNLEGVCCNTSKGQVMHVLMLFFSHRNWVKQIDSNLVMHNDRFEVCVVLPGFGDIVIRQYM